MDKIKQNILKTECPFNWKYPDADMAIEQYIKVQAEKQDTISEEHRFQWQRCVLNLVLGYEVSKKLRDHKRALAHITWVEQLVSELWSCNCDEPFFIIMRPILMHVTLATKAHILMESGNLEEAGQVCEKVKKIGDSDKEKASLFGLKSAMFGEYGPEGHRMALYYANEAAKLDPNEAEWQFGIGKALGKLRRAERNRNMEISDKEIRRFEKACSLRRTGTYLLHLADIYREYSTFLYFNKNNRAGRFDISSSEEYSRKAIELYKDAVELRPECCSTLARVAHGLIRMRHKKLLDLRYIKSLLDKVAEMAPNNLLVNHDLGFYYEKFENNKDRAIFHLNKANEQGNYAAFMAMLTLKWKDRSYRQEVKGDILHAVENIYTEDREERPRVLALLGTVFILLEDNWEEGLKLLMKSLREDNSGKSLLNFWGFSGRDSNLLDIVRREVRSRQRYSSRYNPVFTEFLELCNELRLNPSPSYYVSFEEWKRSQLAPGDRRY